MNYKQKCWGCLCTRRAKLLILFFLNKSMYVCISWAFNVEGRPLTALLLFFYFFRYFFFFFNFVASFFYLACLPPPKVGQILVIQLFVADSKRGERGYMKIKNFPSPKHTSYVKFWVGVLCYPVTTRTALEILYLSRFFL